jgi:hypothetical protein
LPQGGTSAPDGLEIAAEWAKLPAEHLKVALKALEPQLVREHEYRMAMARESNERRERQDLANLRFEEANARRAHRLHMTGMTSGFLITVSMLSGAVMVGTQGQPWLAAMLSGPSVLALATLFVLRRSDTVQAAAVSRFGREALNAAAPPPGPGAP